MPDEGFPILRKLRAEGGAKIFGVFRVKNHDFTPKNHIFPILGGGAPLDPPLDMLCMRQRCFGVGICNILFVYRTKYLLLRCIGVLRCVGVLRGSVYVREESCLVMVCLHGRCAFVSIMRQYCVWGFMLERCVRL